MTRQPVEVAGAVLPASYRTDTSVERDFLTSEDPATLACTLAVGDKWYPTPTPPPPPPVKATITPFVVGQDKPSSKSGGLGPRIATVTKTATDMAGVKAGQVVRGWHVTGFPLTFVAGAYYVDCTFTSTSPTSQYATRFAKLQASTAQPTTYFVNCEFVGSTYTNTWAAALGLHDFVALHCDLTGIDGVDSNAPSGGTDANVYIHASRMRLRPINPDPGHIGTPGTPNPVAPSNWSHADGWEITAGNNHGAIGTEVDTADLQGGYVPDTTSGDPYMLGKLSALMILGNDPTKPTANVTIDSCWFDTWINVNRKTAANITGHINDCYWQYPTAHSPNGPFSKEINFGTANGGALTLSGNQRWLGGSWGPIRIAGTA